VEGQGIWPVSIASNGLYELFLWRYPHEPVIEEYRRWTGVNVIPPEELTRDLNNLGFNRAHTELGVGRLYLVSLDSLPPGEYEIITTSNIASENLLLEGTTVNVLEGPNDFEGHFLTHHWN